MITGKTLIEMGYTPEPWFGAVICHANKHNLTVAQTREFIEGTIPTRVETVEPFRSPIGFHANILAENELEQRNVDAVTAAMNGILTTPTVVDAAIMPDACPVGQGEIPVGAVVATRNAIHPMMHSADVCCSVMATDFGFTDPKEVLNHACCVTHFGMGGRERGRQFPLPSYLKDKIAANPFLCSAKSMEAAQSHLGTQGDGNHFLFVGRSKATGRTMLVTHHGSRGFGAALYKAGAETAESFRKHIAPNVSVKNGWIPFDTAEGKAYWDALQIVREWTKLNHDVIHDAVADWIASERSTDSAVAWDSSIWNEHNFVFKDGDIFYHAKGATPMADRFVPDSKDGLRLIPLNMGQPILVVKASSNATGLGFAPHGAGRNFSRSEHKRVKLEGTTAEDLFREETKGLDVRFFSGKIDISELPSAYKCAKKVREQIDHFGLATVVDEIEPYGCIMAGHADKPWRKR